MQIHEIPAGAIAVGVDGSPSSRQALAFAIDQAAAERRPLILVHAVGFADALWTDQAGHDNRIGLEAGQTSAQQTLTSCRAEVERRCPDLEVHEVLRVADPRVVLLAVAERAALLVVGSRGRGPLRSLLLGSVSVAVTRHADCPVVVVRPGNPGVVRNGILVGVDGTERSHAPLEFAFRQASYFGLPLTVLHAFIDGPADAEEQRLLVAESMSGMREKYPDVPVRTELARGPADECLVLKGRKMNLLVVGSHFGGPSSALLGAVASSVVEHASCPVAVVPVGVQGGSRA